MRDAPIEPHFEVDLAELADARALQAAAMPPLPTPDEAIAYALATFHGLTQSQVAVKIGKSQPVAGRYIAAARAKIEQLVAARVLSRDAIERRMRQSIEPLLRGLSE